jgi:hypothetical protein
LVLHRNSLDTNGSAALARLRDIDLQLTLESVDLAWA